MSHATETRTPPADGRPTARPSATSGLAMMAAVWTLFTPVTSFAQSAGSGGAAGGVGATGGSVSGSGVSGGTTVTAPRPVSPTLGTTSGSDVGSSSSIGGTNGSGIGAGTTSEATGLGSAGGSSGTSTGISTTAPTTNGALSNETTATQGDSTINDINADSIARSGDPGAAAAGGQGSGGATIGMSATEGGLAGSGRPADYDIRTPRIGVDLESIRGALSADPSATPKANGD